MGGDIRTRKVCAFGALSVRNNNTRLAGAGEKRQGIGDRSRGRPAAIPAHHDMIEFEAIFLNKGNDEHRSSGFEQRRLNDDIRGRMIPVPEKAAANAVEQAAKSLRELRVAEVVKLDMQLDAKGKVEAYRAKVNVSFKFEGS